MTVRSIPPLTASYNAPAGSERSAKEEAKGDRVTISRRLQDLQAFGRECDGYSIQIPEASDSGIQKPAEPVISYAIATVGGNNRVIAPSPTTPVRIFSQPSVMPNFDTRFEEQYFHLFHTETADSLAGGLAENLFWKQIVPQACHDHRCIFYLATALAALDQTFRTRKLNSTDKIAEIHHQNALKQYEKGLALLRGLLSSGGESIRIASIASLLIHNFELFHGDTRQAVMQIRSAVQIMRSWVVQNSTSEPRKGLSPAPDVIEEDLVHRFAALEVQLLLWVPPIEPSEPRLLIQGSISQTDFYIPRQFESYSDARESFQMLVTRNVQAVHPSPPSGDANSGLQNSLLFADILCTSDRSDLHEEVLQWLAAFEPLLSSLRMATHRNDFIEAATMKASALGLIILRLEGRSKTDTRPFKVFLPEFREIIALGREVLSHPGFERGFAPDSFMIANLFGVIARCPDTGLQCEALDVIKMMIPRREGLWDSEAAARLGERILTEQAKTTAMDSKDRPRTVGKPVRISSSADLSTQEIKSATRLGNPHTGDRALYMIDFLEMQAHGIRTA